MAGASDKTDGTNSQSEQLYHYDVPLIEHMNQESLQKETFQMQSIGEDLTHTIVLLVPAALLLIYIFFAAIFVFRHRSVLIRTTVKPPERQSGQAIRFEDIIDTVIRYQQLMGESKAETYRRRSIS
ncbi:hypothetical protein BOX15_Mlig012344g2 [Macrostomum lignano]|uniref:Uncharacterized protein n=2 Tax=Macrostomum lignano TaxID=282301 RepID=A0A267DQF1_9PLAT|nr:hypothetical protein BOX15_Mlig012344g2 [Macrostomum lignano]